MPDAQSPDAMKKLVKFIICLALFGSFIALALYLLAVIPGLTPPTNGCVHYRFFLFDWWSCT
jgi:hypothetical protein